MNSIRKFCESKGEAIMSRIEQLIDEIEEFIESCKPQPFSQSKVIVPKDELYE